MLNRNKNQSEETHNLAVDCLVFVLLVAFGAIGRHLTMDWPNFTPLAAVSVFAGFYFRRLSVALLVPLAAMAIANVWLPTYNNMFLATACYAAFFLPVLLPRLLKSAAKPAQAVAYVLAPALVFFLVTNFAVWATSSIYERSFAGLVECYTLAIPFFRTQLAGDLFYLAVVFGTYAMIRAAAPKLAPAAAQQRV